jgi:hypothetical protein
VLTVPQKALNIFNAALVTPTYYVYFTTTTIISSAILFRGFKGTPTSIITVVNGFLTICSGVVLLQLSKSAKDVPDAAVFAGDLDQVQTIAEQAQPETEPKADAIRGTAAIVRRLSSARQKMELEELRRLREEKLQESLEPVTENGVPQFEWDGIRRRRTGTFSTRRSTASPAPTHLAPPTPHPPLGWSHFPTEEELAEANRPVSPALSSLVGTIRIKARSVLPGHPDFHKNPDLPKVQSPMHPVQLTSIAVPTAKPSDPDDCNTPPGTSDGTVRHVQFSSSRMHSSDDASTIPPTPPPHSSGSSGGPNTARRQFSFQNMFRRHQSEDHHPSNHHHHSRPTSSRHGVASRGYSTPHIRGATEEERLGLVKGDSNTSTGSGPNSKSMPALVHYDDDDDDDDESDDDAYGYRGDGGGYKDEDKHAQQQTGSGMYGHSITRGYTGGSSPPRGREGEKDKGGSGEESAGEYEKRRSRLEERRRIGGGDGDAPRRDPRDHGEDRGPPPPPKHGRSYRRGDFI